MTSEKIGFASGLSICLLLQAVSVVSAARYDGKLTITVTDSQTGAPIPARMQLENQRGRTVRLRPDGAVVHGNYFAVPGEVLLELKRGSYRFFLEAGPEYQTRTGHFTIDRHAEDATQVVLNRRVDMASEGWWAGDLDLQHRMEDLPLLMHAAGVSFVPNTSRVNHLGRCQQATPAETREHSAIPPLEFGPWNQVYSGAGGALLVVNAKEDFDICQYNTSLAVLDAAQKQETVAIAAIPYAWELPVWIASEKLNAIQIIDRHTLVDGVLDNEVEGRPRDRTFFPGKQGHGRYCETIYHHLLNCGLRIAPAAGSGSGFNANPIGTNRVYVHCGETMTKQQWLEGLQAGRVIVTNGPLLRTHVEGQPPGAVFYLDENESREFQIGLSLTFYEQAPVEYLELVKNGKVIFDIRLDELARQEGKLPPIPFDESGWFLVRAVTSKTDNYQFATTGPYYVESNYQPRISRRSVQYFLDWLDDATQQFAEEPGRLESIEKARTYWQNLLNRANAE